MTQERSAGRARTTALSPADIRAHELRLAGKSVREIAAEMGGSPSTAHRRVQKVLLAAVRETGAAAVELETQRLDALWAIAFPRALTGDIDWWREALKLSQRRSRLEGHDAPQRVTVTQLDPITAEMERLAAEFLERAKGAPVPQELPGV